MKIFFLSILFIMIILLSCSEQSNNSNNDNYMSEGKITGFDTRECMCCGGWFIKIDTTIYRFDVLPVKSGLNLDSAIFPVEVKLDWKKKDKPCMSDEIIVSRIKKK